MGEQPYSAYISTPLGVLRIILTTCEITRIEWVESDNPISSQVPSPYKHLFEEAVHQFGDYWAGDRTLFNLPCRFYGYSPFMCLVWQALIEIPYGATCSYKDVALCIGKPLATRAVGKACAKNPFAIVVPCHRVVMCNGFIGHYSAPGGASLKKAIIDFEKLRLREKGIHGRC